jgi:hypothetical protein
LNICDKPQEVEGTSTPRTSGGFCFKNGGKLENKVKKMIKEDIIRQVKCAPAVEISRKI